MSEAVYQAAPAKVIPPGRFSIEELLELGYSEAPGAREVREEWPVAVPAGQCLVCYPLGGCEFCSRR